MERRVYLFSARPFLLRNRTVALRFDINIKAILCLKILKFLFTAFFGMMHQVDAKTTAYSGSKSRNYAKAEIDMDMAIF